MQPSLDTHVNIPDVDHGFYFKEWFSWLRQLSFRVVANKVRPEHLMPQHSPILWPFFFQNRSLTLEDSGK